MPVQIQIRRDSAADWSSNNPTLAQGEIGIETDTDKYKVGDGSTAWNSLSYIGYIVSSDDTTPDYLENKIIAGDNVTITTISGGSNEKLQISASGGGISGISVEEDDVEKASSVTVLNFKSRVAVSDAGGGQANIYINPSGGASLIVGNKSSVLGSGEFAQIEVPYPCTLTAMYARELSDISGDADLYLRYYSTLSDLTPDWEESISLSSSYYAASSGLSRSMVPGSILRLNASGSPTSVKRVMVAIRVTRE